MPQPTDITINAAGYMIEPGSPTNPGYKRLQDGYPEGRTTRLAITDFIGGQCRALQLERDRLGDGLSVGPKLNGQGVAPWGITRAPNFTDFTTNGLPARDTPIPTVIVQDIVYFAINRTLYRAYSANGVLNIGYAVVKTYANPITDLCIYASAGILICFGSAADILFRNMSTGTEAVLMAGERGHHIAAYAGYALWSDARTASRPTVIRQVTGNGIETRRIDHDPIAITVADAEAYIISKQAIYSYAGRVRDVMVNNPAWVPGGGQPAQIPGQEWSGDYTPFYQQGVYSERDDFRVFTGFGGRILAWIAGGIHELVPSGDRAGWRSTGLTGKRCFGGTIAAGYLIVCIESESGKNEIWAYNGTGWWRIAQKDMPVNADGTWCNPVSIGSGPSGTAAAFYNLTVFEHNGTTALQFRLADQVDNSGTYHTNYAPTAHVITSMIDAGERDKTKAWRKLGAVFASPVLLGNVASADSVTVYLDYSTDAGASWTNVQSVSKTGNTVAHNNFDLAGALSGVTSRFIMLRVRWESVSDWAPVLTGLWVEYEVMDTPARRRKWQLRIHARDQEIDRAGAVFSRTGRQLIAELWQAWEQDTVLPFRDIDYDDDPTERSVRIVGIAEHVAQPADSNRWGESTIMLNLVEV